MVPPACLTRCFLDECISACCGTVSIVFFVAAAAGTLYDSGMLQAFYCIPTPLGAMAVQHMMDLWIDSLPSQVNAPHFTPSR